MCQWSGSVFVQVHWMQKVVVMTTYGDTSNDNVAKWRPFIFSVMVCIWMQHWLVLAGRLLDAMPAPEPKLTCHCPACRTTLVATRFRVAVICPIIQVPHCIRVFFYFVWFVFINHIFQFYYELCTYCNILDIYLSWNLNFVNYVLFYMKLLNYLFFSMFGSVLESCELTGVCLLLPWLIKWK